MFPFIATDVITEKFLENFSDGIVKNWLSKEMP